MRALKIVGYVCIGILVTLSLLWWGCGPHEPSDAALELRFQEQRPELERLVDMSDEDPEMTRIADTFLWKRDNVGWPRPQSEWGISKERWAEYKRIFKRSDVDGGISRWGEDVRIMVWRWGIVPSGITVSYLHCGSLPTKSDSADPACAEQKETGTGKYGRTSWGYRYKKLTNEWYILEEFN
jgi:hypothetical protein